MRYIDIHAHLDDKAFTADRADVLNRLVEHDVGVITIGTTKKSSEFASALSRENASVWACIGIHPEDGASEEFVNEEFKALLHSKVVAVGECGLDYFRKSREEVYERQKKLFEMQIQFAIAHNLPLMLHVRPSKGSLDAYNDALEILESYKVQYPALKGNSHFFAGDVPTATRFFDIDFTISFTGVITFASEYDEVITYAPLERMHAETDAPYVAPVPFRKERNNPLHVREVYRRIAEIKGIEENSLREAFLHNANSLFALNK